MVDDYRGRAPRQQSVENRDRAEGINAPLPPDDPNSPAAQTVPKQTKKTQIEQLEDQIKRAERWMIGLTGAIAFFGLCQVIVGIFQWNAMSGQLNEMRGSGNQTERLVILNQGQLIQNAKLADAAKTQAEKSETISDNVKRAADQMERSANQAEVAAKQSAAQSKLPWMPPSPYPDWINGRGLG